MDAGSVSGAFASVATAPFRLGETAIGAVRDVMLGGQTAVGQTITNVAGVAGGAVEDVTDTANPLNAAGLGIGLSLGGAGGVIILGLAGVVVAGVADQLMTGGAGRMWLLGSATRRR